MTLITNYANYLWFTAAVLFFLFELILPGFVIFYFGIGALGVYIVLLIAKISFASQLTVFLAASILFMVTTRKFIRAKFFNSKNAVVTDGGFIGFTATVITYKDHENIKVTFRGTIWDAETAEETAFRNDEKAEICGINGSSLIIKKK